MDKTLLKKIENLCESNGEEPGFQFCVTCTSCNEKIYSDFINFEGTITSSLFQKKSEPDLAWNNQKREAFQAAATYFEDILVYCEKCDSYVCESCFLTDRGMCMKCCTDIAKRVLDESWHQLHSNIEQAQKCQKCGAKVGKAKFCPKCGEKQKVVGICEGCSARIPEDALFCPECGKKV